MYISTPQNVQYRSKIHRILLYIGEFSCSTSGGVSTGDIVRLQFNIKVNDITIYTFYVDYDESQESDIITNFVLDDYTLESGCDSELYPEDIIKIEMLEDLSSGYTLNYDNVVFKIFTPKIKY